jgi:hypothetical protein
MIKTSLLLATAYLASWIIHGKLIERIKLTSWYMNKEGRSFRAAWRRSGLIL